MMGNVFYMRKGLVHNAPIVSDPHTLLLLHGESIEDASMYHVPLTNKGAQVSSKQSKFGGKSLHFDGKSRIAFPSTACNFGSGDFTVDWWEWPAEDGELCRVATQMERHKGLVLGGGGKYIYATSPTGDLDIFNKWDVLNLTPNTWTHFAVVRHGNNFSVYRNGNLIGQKPITRPIGNDTSIFASLGTNASETNFFKGYIDEFRISDIARWTSDFTPPDKPYKG